MITRAFKKAFNTLVERGWDSIYVLVDLHGVCVTSGYGKKQEIVYPECVEPLRTMAANPKFKLIMWTCSKPEEIEKYKKNFEGLGIYFKYFNENPEVTEARGYGDYTKKLYANIIIDDKAGFEPQDWLDVSAAIWVKGEWKNQDYLLSVIEGYEDNVKVSIDTAGVWVTHDAGKFNVNVKGNGDLYFYFNQGDTSRTLEALNLNDEKSKSEYRTLIRKTLSL